MILYNVFMATLFQSQVKSFISVRHKKNISDSRFSFVKVDSNGEEGTTCSIVTLFEHGCIFSRANRRIF